MIVARTMPTTATRIVFRKPTRKARPKVLAALYSIIDWPMSKPDGRARNPNPLATPSRARFAMVLLTRIQPPRRTSSNTSSW